MQHIIDIHHKKVYGYILLKDKHFMQTIHESNLIQCKEEMSKIDIV